MFYKKVIKITRDLLENGQTNIFTKDGSVEEDTLLEIARSYTARFLFEEQ